MTCIHQKIFLFARNIEDPMSRTTVNPIIRKAKLMLDKEETITPYTFRHSFTTMLTEEGKNLFIIQKILGHSNI